LVKKVHLCQVGILLLGQVIFVLGLLWAGFIWAGGEILRYKKIGGERIGILVRGTGDEQAGVFVFGGGLFAWCGGWAENRGGFLL
jgi:hypothetical protein